MKRILWILLAFGPAVAEIPTIPTSRMECRGEECLAPTSAAWKTVPQVQIALNRTPPIYSTDAPSALEIPAARVQVIQAEGKSVMRLEWRDPTNDSTAPAGAPDRFFDACAVMLPARAGDIFPSLQMGDPDHPVVIYYFDAKRGAAVMEAAGRGTTRRTGKTFSARAAYTNQNWQVTMELPELAAGTPFSVAIWNGSQQDRDGRKYFSVWYRTR